MDKIFHVNFVKSDIYYLNLATFLKKKKTKEEKKIDE